MPTRTDTEQRLTRSADALVRAVRKQIDRWLREGVSMQEILTRLSAFRLPASEQAKLERAVKVTMEEIAKARSLALPGEHIDALIASRQVSVGGIRQQMQADLQAEVRRALVAGYGPDVLRKRLEARGFGNAQTEAQTAVSRFNNLLTFENAAATGTQHFKYFGPVSAVTRPFCRAHAGQVFSLDEIRQMNNGQGLPVLESLGGYNCRHTWVPAEQTTDEQRSAVTIGKQTYLMDEEQKRTLFERERSLWIQTPEATASKPASWFLTAKPLARAHDGFNEQITGQLSDGAWAPIYKNGFDEHYMRRRTKGEVATANDYRATMQGLMKNGNAEVYDTTSDDGSKRLLVFDPKTHWLLMIDERGLVRTAFRQNRDSETWQRRKLLGTLDQFIGRF